MLPIKNVNWPVVVPLAMLWDKFQSIIADKLGMRTEEIKLSYKFSGFTANENAEALRSQDHFRTMMTRAQAYLDGKCKVRGNRVFRIYLDPTFEQPDTADAGVPKKCAEKVSCALHGSSPQL